MEAHSPGRRWRPLRICGALGAAALVALSACSSKHQVTSSTAASGDYPRLDGVTLNVFVSSDSFAKALKPFAEEFQSKTGATVNYQAGTTDQAFFAKLTLDLRSGRGPDLFLAPLPLRGQYVSLGAQPIDSYINKAPASWDYHGIPSGIRQGCMQDGKTYCIPVEADMVGLYYNKKHFADAGLTQPPQSMAELQQYAQKLTTNGHSGFCTRGSIAQGTVFNGQAMLAYFMKFDPGNKATWLDPQWKPQLNTPDAYAFGNWWKTVMRNYAPKGVGNYGSNECIRDFNQGKTSMVWDTSAFSAELLDPKANPDPKNVGFAAVPCPDNTKAPDGSLHCGFNSPWGFYIPKSARNASAAFELERFLSSPEEQAKYPTTGESALLIRPSLFKKAFDGSNPLLPADLGKGISYGLSNLQAGDNALPQIPTLLEFLQPLAVAQSKILSGSDVQSAMNEAQDADVQILKRAGKLN
jgi:multiple sugar transport system substrate-binding protein